MISTTAACGWLPRAPYLGGPLDGSAAPPLRRKAETVHPTYRTADGKSIRGEVPPDHPHYAQRDHDVINSIHDTGGWYEWVPAGPSAQVDTCAECGQRLLLRTPGRTRCERCRLAASDRSHR